jgi:transcriptional regulator with XRE-family HTH domain
LNVDATLKRSGISQSEFGYIVGVSRIMVNRYARGHSKPNQDRVARVELALKVINQLVDHGKLPLPEWDGVERRMKAIKKLKKFIIARR